MTTRGVPVEELVHWHEAPIRRALIDALHSVAGADAVIVPEMAILEGRSRIDVACISQSLLCGYEIKSLADAIDKRLDRQVAAYGRVVDLATLVVAEEHLPVAMRRVPEWWGVMVVTHRQSKVVLETLRPGVPNPHPDPMGIASFLWREEALRILRERGAARNMTRKTRRELWQRLCQVLTLDELRVEVRQFLRRRFSNVAIATRIGEGGSGH